MQVSVSPGGVPKTAVPRARVTAAGVEGNGHANRRVHGGPDQAVLVIAKEWLDRFAAEGFSVFPGALGENLTVEGVDLALLPPGARLAVGNDVVLRVTKARVPCKNIERYGEGIGKRIFNRNVKRGDATDALWGASGLMCAVEREGEVAPGDAVKAA